MPEQENQSLENLEPTPIEDTPAEDVVRSEPVEEIGMLDQAERKERILPDVAADPSQGESHVQLGVQVTTGEDKLGVGEEADAFSIEDEPDAGTVREVAPEDLAEAGTDYAGEETASGEPVAAIETEPAAPVAVAEPEPAAPPAPPTPKPEVKHAWYVVHCYSGYENKVKKSLEQHIISDGMQDRIFRVVVPVEREVEIKEGQRKNIERRVFPGYIMVEMMELHEGDPNSDQAWYVVRNTPGVTGFVSSGDKPVPLRQEEVDKILKRMETAEPKVHVTFRPGQTVHIIDGPFADFRGTVDEVNMEKGKVRVMVSFFGRDTPVELDLLQVEKV